MSAKKFRLTVVTTVRENGYDWTVVECPECGEQVQRRHIRDAPPQEEYRADVCPACDESMDIGGGSSEIVMPSVRSQSTIAWENNQS